MKKDTEVARSETAKIGFLPYLSDSLPIIGAEKNWPMENAAARNPISKGDAPNFWAKNGRSGNTIPNPIMVIKAAKYKSKICERIQTFIIQGEKLPKQA